MFNTFSDPYLNFAFRTGVGAVLVTLVLALAIIYLRLHHHLLERREQAFATLWRPPLMQILVGENITDLPALRPREYWLFLKLWNHFQESLRGDATRRLNEVAYRLGCNHVARRLLKHGNRTERFLAILTLGRLQDDSAWDELLMQARSADRTASIYAAHALIQIQPAKAIPQIMPLLLTRKDWDIVRVAILLQESRTALVEVLVNSLMTLPQDQLLRALKLAEALHLPVPAHTLIALLGPGQPAEVVIGALRVASGSEVLESIRAHAHHPDWRVRVHVAKGLERLGDASDVPRLTDLLNDKEWWVRYRAAQALARAPFLSRAELESLQTTLPDRYARDILGQVLAENDQPLSQSPR